MQLGPAFHVYPGATHTRASHSFGVFHLAKRLLIRLAEQGADEWLSREGVFSFLCAALLHDLGHFPFTHSLKELPLEAHESLTAKIILCDPVKSLVIKAGGNPDFTAAIVDNGLNAKDHKLKGEEKELSFYRKLLSGTLDPDKLDYLNRDARCCGVPYGAQDVDFILSCLHPHPIRGTDIDEKGITSIESILFSKYLMYRTVYWHRSVRSATAMIKKVVLNALENKIIAPNELYNLDDQEFFTLMERKKLEVKAVWSGQLYVPAVEFHFDKKTHGVLSEISKRTEFEKNLTQTLCDTIKKLTPDKLIIDIPEPISFESDLYITDKNCFFPESSSVFKGQMINSLVTSLRIVRIFIDPAVLSKNNEKDILQITQKWLMLL